MAAEHQAGRLSQGDALNEPLVFDDEKDDEGSTVNPAHEEKSDGAFSAGIEALWNSGLFGFAADADTSTSSSAPPAGGKYQYQADGRGSESRDPSPALATAVEADGPVADDSNEGFFGSMWPGAAEKDKKKEGDYGGVEQEESRPKDDSNAGFFGSMWPGAADDSKSKNEPAAGGDVFDVDSGGYTSNAPQSDENSRGFDVDAMGSGSGGAGGASAGAGAGGKRDSVGGQNIDMFDLDSGGFQATGQGQPNDAGFDVDSMGGGGGAAAVASRRGTATASAYAATVARASKEDVSGYASAVTAEASVQGQVHDARAVGDVSDEEEEFHF